MRKSIVEHATRVIEQEMDRLPAALHWEAFVSERGGGVPNFVLYVSTVAEPRIVSMPVISLEDAINLDKVRRMVREAVESIEDHKTQRDIEAAQRTHG